MDLDALLRKNDAGDLRKALTIIRELRVLLENERSLESIRDRLKKDLRELELLI